MLSKDPGLYKKVGLHSTKKKTHEFTPYLAMTVGLTSFSSRVASRTLVPPAVSQRDVGGTSNRRTV